MSANSKIEWCDHTFNPWIGCTKVSPGCANCYAAVSTRARVLRAAGQETWGKGAPRSRTQTWGEPLKWNREVRQIWEESGCSKPGCGFPDGRPCIGCGLIVRRPRVFCASLADWLDDEVPIEWLSDLLYLIAKCPNLDWLLLTKRPQNFRPRMEAVAELMDVGGQLARYWLDGQIPPHVWIGTTVEDQERADLRIPQLLAIPAKIRFLSCEPLLGPVEFSNVSKRSDCIAALGKPALDGIHWVIAGGESGTNARPMHPRWASSLMEQCKAAGVPFLFKQWGEHAPATEGNCHKGIRFVELDGTDSTDWTLDRHSKTTGMLAKVGKKSAGRLLRAFEHNNFPLSAATGVASENPAVAKCVPASASSTCGFAETEAAAGTLPTAEVAP